jgi:uncharacterized membrane protein YfcA
LGSLAGMGGGFVMIPAMTTLLKLTQHQAHGTSLCAVAATAVAGAASYGDQVQVVPALSLAATAAVTARWGARSTLRLSQGALKRALGGLMLLMAPAVPAKAHLIKRKKQEEHEQNLMADSKGDKKEPPTLTKRVLVPAATGVVSGYLAGLLGVGGGTVVVPALVVFTDMSHIQALATSLAAMVVPAATGTFQHWKQQHVVMRVAPALALGACVGAYAGGQLALHTKESTLQWGFSGLLFTLGVRTLMKA